MSIENPRLVVKSAKRDGESGRETPPPVCISIWPVDPIANSSFIQNGGTSVSTLPECAGQVVAYSDPALPNYVRLFVAINSTTWKRVSVTFFLDPRTGKPYDPNASFYNPLAF